MNACPYPYILALLFQFLCLYSYKATKPYNESSMTKHQRKFAVYIELDVTNGMKLSNHLEFRLGLVDIPNPIKPFVRKLIKHTVSLRT